MTLAAETLDVTGRVTAGGDISLVATNRQTIADSSARAVGLDAGDRLLLQGDRSLQISALTNPASDITSGGDTILKSDAPIVGDATFTAGGSILIERLDGRFGDLISDGDPVFQTAGDFSTNSYTGASLQILAGGSVTIPGTIEITAAGGPFNDSTVVLSDGTSLSLIGSSEPTVDIRSGTTQFFGGRPSAGGTPSSATIQIGTIDNPGGTVYLTNQFQPNPGLTGDISVGQLSTADLLGGGTVIIDSQNGITFRTIDVSGGDSFDLTDPDFDPFAPPLTALGGNGGDVKLLAGGDIVMPNQSFLRSHGLRGGNITLDSETAIVLEDGPAFAFFEELSFIESYSTADGRGGDINLSAPSISIGGNIFADTYGTARGGDLTLTGGSLVANNASINTDTFGPGDSGTVRVEVDTISLELTSLGSFSISDSGGRSGDVVVRADTVTLTDGAQVGSLADFVGDAGDVSVFAEDISLTGISTGIFSSVSDFAFEGNSGTLTIATDTLRINGGAFVSTSSFSFGSAGDININASESITLDGAEFDTFLNASQPSAITSELFTGAEGEGGSILINTPVLRLIDGGTITTLSDGIGNAGTIDISASQSVTVDGIQRFPQGAQFDRPSRIAVITETEAIGDAGRLRIDAPEITLSDGGQLTAESRGIGEGGDIILNGENLVLHNGGLVSTETVSNTGGDITLTFSEVIALTDNSRISSTAGTDFAGGDGGNILINAEFVTAEPDTNNDITANAFEGRGGRVEISATGIFGLTPRSRQELEALLGTTDPLLLDPAFLPTSDITAISRVNPELDGVVVIRSPDVDPNRDITELPSNVVDTSRLIAQGCSASGSLGNVVGSLIVTGRGGLPQSPVDSLGNQDLLIAWDTFEDNNEKEADRISETNRDIEDQDGKPEAIALSPDSLSEADSPKQIVEFQSLTQREDGKVILTAQLPQESHPSRWNPAAACVAPIP